MMLDTHARVVSLRASVGVAAGEEGDADELYVFTSQEQVDKYACTEEHAPERVLKNPRRTKCRDELTPLDDQS